MNIPIERRAEAARIYEEFLDQFNTALLEVPDSMPISRNFAVYMASAFNYERGFDIKDMHFAKEVLGAIGQLEERIAALEAQLADK